MKQKVGDQIVEISQDEYDYYIEIIGNLNGTKDFVGLFEVDEDGFITIVKPTKPIPQIVLFFINQLMISQRLRWIDEMRKAK